MSTLLAAEGLGHNFNEDWLFKNITVGLNKGQRIALVGQNGTGKSTLMKLLSGKDKAREGKIVLPKGLRIGYLEQNPEFPSQCSISDYLFSKDNEVLQYIRKYEELLEENIIDEQEINKLYDKIIENNSWEYEQSIKNILSRLGITQLKKEINTLSGGQKKRLALAKLLIEEPEVWLLDEPTNHLDIETIEWLEKILSSGNKTLLLITHDRYFLDNVCNAIIELDKGNLFIYKGNYAYFLEKKSEREELEDIAFQKNKNLLKKELEWMRRMPQARGTKSQARKDAFYALEAKTKARTEREKVNLNIDMARQGSKILEITQVSHSYDQEPIINNFNYIFKKGDRIGLAGKNGSGKTTLLNIITKQIEPSSGKVIIGETTKIGYYKQEGLSFDQKDRVIDTVKNEAEYIKMANGDTLSASALLSLFLFPPKKQHGLVEKLSGGEKKRLHLMKILMQNPNFLILDEPTNDLDIDTLNVLEQFLVNYNGVMVLVSHDRYLLDKLCNQLFIAEGNGNIKIYNGNYADYRNELEAIKESSKKIETKISETKTDKKSNKLSYKEQQELKKLEEELSHLEERIKENTILLNSVEPSDYQKIQELSTELSTNQEEMDKKMERWIELSEK